MFNVFSSFEVVRRQQQEQRKNWPIADMRIACNDPEAIAERVSAPVPGLFIGRRKHQ